MLAMCGIRRNFRVIYILPSARFAGEFAKTRVDPIIETSERLSKMIVAGADGAMMKRIGSSTLYMGGAATKAQAISRPADCLIMDEVDFANQEVLTSYMGRIAHSLDPIVRKFSTPTISGYGINAELERSDKRRYFVRCEHCGTRQAPDFNKAVRIPGWDHSLTFRNFSKADLINPEYQITESYLECESCQKSLTASLLDPANREWVSTNQAVQLRRGYEIKPFDLPRYNPISKLVSRFGDYSDEEDYWNFVQGETFDSDENQVALEALDGMFSVTSQENPTSPCMGVDVGRHECHVLVGVPGLITAAYVLSISDGPFAEQIASLYRHHGCVQGVIDIGPEASIGRDLHSQFGNGFLMASYRKDIPQDPGYFSLPEDSQVVSVQRTKCFNRLVKALNRGEWKFVPTPHKSTICRHLRGMKRLRQDSEEGVSSGWVKVGDDHFLHALGYLQTACDLGEVSGSGKVQFAALPSIAGVDIGGSLTSRERPSGMVISGGSRQIFGVF